MKKVKIIAQTESFIIKGAMKKMEDAGLTTEFMLPDMEAPQEMFQDVLVYVIIVDDSAADVMPFINSKRDVFSTVDVHVILVGTNNDAKAFDDFLSFNEGWEFVERPMDISTIIAKCMTYVELDDMEEEKPCILVIDDDKAYCTMLRTWLKKYYRVKMANSGTYAITWLATNHADLILLDYNMPVTSGPLVLEMLRSEPSTAMIPVVFLTGIGDKESIVKVLDLKPTDYLLKSIKKTDLLEKIKSYLNN